MAASQGEKDFKTFNKVPSLDYSNDEELTEDTRLMYERYNNKMDDTTMDVCIFLRDRTGIHVSLEEGHQAEADDLFDIVLQDQGLPIECEDVFALWLVSPLIELRLKKKHKPFFMVQQWDELCSKYTDAKAEEIHEDEPVLMFQRNVFFPKEQEVNISYEQVLGILYHEAKFNVLEGRYIMHPEEYHTLAGIQALIKMGKYNQRDHLIQTYRASLNQFYPEHMYKKKTGGFFAKRKAQDTKDSVEERWLNAHRQISQEFENEDLNKVLGQLYQRYLQICWPYPFYGAAFFDSFINKPLGKLAFLKRNHNVETWTAINTDGVCLIDREKDEVLLAVPYSELCWEYVEPQFDVDDDAFPCILLQFLTTETTEGVERRVTKILQVYSRQAKMMVALIESCVQRKKLKRQGIPAIDDVDGMTGENEFHSRCINKLDKLCLSTFTTSGECLD